MSRRSATDFTDDPVPIDIREEGADALPAYASISIAYEVAEILDVLTGGEVPVLKSHPLPQAVTKDYDSEPGNSPLLWPTRFDISEWGFLSAHTKSERVGGATVIIRPSEVDLLDGRNDLALLWDIRVAPAHRGRGIGSALLVAAERWARGQGRHMLKVETQSINAPACRFYAGHGFTLVAANHGAYPTLPDEIQLIWYKDLLDYTSPRA